jgi:hypothetical protein
MDKATRLISEDLADLVILEVNLNGRAQLGKNRGPD